MNYEDEPVLGEKQARNKLNMIEGEKELAEYIRNLLDKFPVEAIKQAQMNSIVKEEPVKIEVPELKISDIVIIEDRYTGIYQECVIITTSDHAVTDKFTIVYNSSDGNRLYKYKVSLNERPVDDIYRVKEIYRRINSETFKRIWKAD